MTHPQLRPRRTTYGKWLLVALIWVGVLFPGAGPSLSAEEGGPAGPEAAAKLSRSDKSFLRDAAEENQAAIELGQVAERKGFGAAARNFARSLVAQRRRAQQELLAVARQVNLVLPLKLSRRDRKAKRQLEKNSGQQLDRIFLAHMAADLDRQYGNYEDTAMRTRSPEIKHYIETLLSQVKQQDQVAKEMAPVESRPESNPQ
ncbi:MAG: DUF4142 domain-containing protein [Acidobacteriota bacterium]